MKNKFIALILIVVFIIGCRTKEEFPKVTFVDDSKTEKLELSNHSGSVTIKLETFKLIEPTNSQLSDIVNSDIQSFLLSKYYVEGTFENIQEMKDTLFNEYKNLVNNFPDIPYSYSLERIVNPETDTLGVFSFSKFEVTFLGGAHPNSVKTFSNYDVKTNKLIELSDIFMIEDEEELTKIAESLFRKQKELNEDESFDEAGYWFEDGKFELNNNFLITEEGILFYYNPYEIAAYAVGATELHIPFKSISKLIKTDSLLERFLD